MRFEVRTTSGGLSARDRAELGDRDGSRRAARARTPRTRRRPGRSRRSAAPPRIAGAHPSSSGRSRGTSARRACRPAVVATCARTRADLQHLARVVPLVEGLVGVDALVALQADERRRAPGERLRHLGLADADLALEEERSSEGRTTSARWTPAVGEVAPSAEEVSEVLDAVQQIQSGREPGRGRCRRLRELAFASEPLSPRSGQVAARFGVAVERDLASCSCNSWSGCGPRPGRRWSGPPRPTRGSTSSASSGCVIAPQCTRDRLGGLRGDRFGEDRIATFGGVSAPMSRPAGPSMRTSSVIPR